MLMAVCRAYARASVSNLDPLRAAIVQLNRLVSHDFDDGRFVTFAVALLRPDHDEIELLSAGHGPSLVCRRAGGAIEEFEGDGLPLGIVPDEEFTEPRPSAHERGGRAVYGHRWVHGRRTTPPVTNSAFPDCPPRWPRMRTDRSPRS